MFQSCVFKQRVWAATGADGVSVMRRRGRVWRGQKRRSSGSVIRSAKGKKAQEQRICDPLYKEQLAT
jgi:hypothetical protein